MQKIYEGTYYATELNKQVIEKMCKHTTDVVGDIVELKVVDIYGETGDIMCATTDGQVKVCIPLEEFSVQHTTYARRIRCVGTPILMRISSYDTEKNMYIGTRKQLQEEYMRTVCATWDVKNTIIDALVTYVSTEKVYLDVGYGVSTYLTKHTASFVGWNNMQDMYAVGDEVKVVMVHAIEDNKIYVAQKPLMGTWQSNVNRAEITENIYRNGVVLAVKDYGIFVALSANLVGLAEPVNNNVVPGAYVKVRVREVYPAKEKIKLYIEEVINKDETLLRNDKYDIAEYDKFIESGDTIWTYGIGVKDIRDVVFVL